jgi:hypothetical protein
MKAWFQKRPFLLWLLVWSTFGEILFLTFNKKPSMPLFPAFHIQPMLLSLLYCVRPKIATILRVFYGIVMPVAISLSVKYQIEWIMGVGVACFPVLGMDLLLHYAKSKNH